jgi:hypothetical protein
MTVFKLFFVCYIKYTMNRSMKRITYANSSWSWQMSNSPVEFLTGILSSIQINKNPVSVLILHVCKLVQYCQNIPS